MALTEAEIEAGRTRPTEYSCEGLAAFLICGMVLSSIAVTLRLWSRKLRKMEWAADDYTIIIALFLILGANVCLLLMIYRFGWGRHMSILPESQLIPCFKSNYAFNLLYTTGYPLSKVSLALFYRRLFVQRWFRCLCWVMIACFVSYSIATVIIDVQLVLPINAYWDFTVTPTKSLDGNSLFMANAAFNIITDILLLIMPLAVIWRLQMSVQQKIGVSVIFAMGIFTCIASIMRLVLYQGIKGNDITFIFGPTGWWTSAEVFLGIICACLPTFRPLFKLCYEMVASSLTSYASSSAKQSSAHSSSFVKLRDMSTSRKQSVDYSQSSVAPLPPSQRPEKGDQWADPAAVAVGPRAKPADAGANIGTHSKAYFEKDGSGTSQDLEQGFPQNAIGVKTVMQMEKEKTR
ncbi:MAG: hypothetical protein M1817_004941 [Caeruleum heppii]|nr:MAG: hypothetical protein M1817_004941 [Caeruleum heppii]